MSLDEFEQRVRQQIQHRKPVDFPEDRAIQVAVRIFKELGAIRADGIPQCAAAAIVIADAYPQEHKDTGQPAVAAQGRPITDQVSDVQACVVQGREDRFKTSAAPCRTIKAAQTYFARLSNGDPLLSHFHDIASATKLEVSTVAMWLLAGQEPALSSCNMATVDYSIASSSPEGKPSTLQFSTLEGLNGHIHKHTWDSWLPGYRQHVGHKPHERIPKEDALKKKAVIRTFLDEQQKAWGWSQQAGWPDGEAPKRFWPTVEQVWQEQHQHQWGKMSSEALRKADKRSPQSMPHKGRERTP